VDRYQRLADSGHPLTEAFAEQLYVRTPQQLRPDCMQRLGTVWEHETPERREAWRDRARRFMAGDLSLAPWALTWSD